MLISLFLKIGGAYLTYRAVRYFLFRPTHGLYSLRGPPSQSFVHGNLGEIFYFSATLKKMEHWLKEYGLVFRVNNHFGGKALLIADPVAATHVLKNSMIYPKPEALSDYIKTSVGPGLVAAEGKDHQRQRKIVNPAFSTAQIKHAFDSVMMNKAHELCNLWTKQVNESGDKHLRMDVLEPLGNLTFDIIAETGFGCHFDSVNGVPNELVDAFRGLLKASHLAKFLRFLSRWFPPLARLPIGDNLQIDDHFATIRRVGAEIAAQRKIEVSKASEAEKEELLGKDLLSVLIKSNMMNPPSHSMSDREIESQIALFMFAGKDSTASSLAWTLAALSRNPEVQAKLRAELLAFPHDRPSFDELSNFEYLDWVLKESLRRHAPLDPIQRCALQDDIIPLSEPVVDKDGKLHREIVVKAGDSIILSTHALSLATCFWGPEAGLFKPERFAELPGSTSSIPSVYGNIPPFLAGPRTCVGWRYALIKMKAVLFVLIRSFEIDIDPKYKNKVWPSPTVAARPCVPELPGCQLPLRLSLLSGDNDEVRT